MQINIQEFSIKTAEKFQIIDITGTVEKYITEKNITTGLLTITTTHTTSAIRVNENESRLLNDIKNQLEKYAPSDWAYLHDDIEKRNCPKDEPKNAHAHLKAMTMGASESLPIKDKKLVLGQWQRIFFIELDGPRERKYNLTIIGE